MKENIELVIIVIISIIALVYGFYLLSQMPSEIIKKMDKECKEQLKKRDEEYEKEKEFHNALKEWLFK